MDIDVTALKSLVREKNLSLDLVVETIEAALLVAYQRTARPRTLASNSTARPATSPCGPARSTTRVR